MARDSINWVILLDNTFDMKKKDYRPNRFQVALQGVRDFIRMKCVQNPDAFISLYIYSTQTMVLAELTKNPARILQQIKTRAFIKQHPPVGTAGELYHTIQNAIESLTTRIQSIGGESYRILVITGSLQVLPPDEFHVDFPAFDHLLHLKRPPDVVQKPVQRRVFVHQGCHRIPDCRARINLQIISEDIPLLPLFGEDPVPVILQSADLCLFFVPREHFGDFARFQAENHRRR